MEKQNTDKIEQLQARLKSLDREIAKRDMIIVSLSEEQSKAVSIRSQFRKFLGAIDRSIIARIENIKKREVIDRTDEANASITEYSRANTAEKLLNIIHDYDNIAFIPAYEPPTIVTVIGEVFFSIYRALRLIVRNTLFALNALLKKTVGIFR